MEVSISKKLRKEILKWWKLGRNVWEISQITGASEPVVFMVINDD